MKNLVSKIARILNRPRVLHYVDIFLAGFAVSLAANKDHLLGAHGLGVWKSLAAGAAIAGAKAVIETYRKSTPLPSVPAQPEPDTAAQPPTT